ncbi:MAG TPA: hypothetical protein VKH81_01560 [Candidatus Angelobacter sp.]|nr:hypothetical protein [Candidatus Angelobacter sp.]
MNTPAPFACNMTALSRDARARHAQLGEFLRSALSGVHELPNGYEFEFPPLPANYRALTELTPLEHACCPFFDIAIVLSQDDKLLWRLTGGEGVKPFIRHEFALWVASRSA